MYALERRVGEEFRGQLYPRWKRYAMCGTRRPLERVRVGQEKPEEWRVTKASVSLSQLCRRSTPVAQQEKAS